MSEKKVEEQNFPKEWTKIVQFVKYMRNELLKDHENMETSFRDLMELFIYLIGSKE